MKKVLSLLLIGFSLIGFSCEKDNHEDHHIHSEVCQMCTDTDGDGEIDCMCDCHCTVP